MKHQNDILGRKIINIEEYDEYIHAFLDNGMEIEISDVMTKEESEKEIEEIQKINIEERKWEVKQAQKKERKI